MATTNYPGSTEEEDRTFEKAQALLDSEGLGNVKVAVVVDDTVQLWDKTLFGNVPGAFFESWEDFENWVRTYDGAE